MECDEIRPPLRCFAVERLCKVGNESGQDGARIPAELKSQLRLKAASADPNWKFDVSCAKREELSKIEPKGCKPLSLPPTSYDTAYVSRKRAMLKEPYTSDVAKCPRCWLTENGDSVDVFSQLTSTLCDIFLRADRPKRMQMSECLESMLVAFGAAKHFANESKPYQ